jgi:hypothetical protein
MSATARPYGTSRAEHVNYGDRTPIKADQQKVLANISVNEAQAFTLYVTVRLEPETATVVPLVTVEWGNGGASITAREHRVTRRLRVPIVASTVKVSGRLVDSSGAPLSPKSPVTGHFVAFLAPGTDGETLRNTRWVSQRGAQGIVSNGPEQILTVEGYTATPSYQGWLMLFDARALPAPGAFPAMAVPVSRGASLASRGRFRLERFDTQGFQFGVRWAASSTPMTFTLDPTADLRVDVEVLT